MAFPAISRGVRTCAAPGLLLAGIALAPAALAASVGTGDGAPPFEVPTLEELLYQDISRSAGQDGAGRPSADRPAPPGEPAPDVSPLVDQPGPGASQDGAEAASGVTTLVDEPAPRAAPVDAEPRPETPTRVDEPGAVTSSVEAEGASGPPLVTLDDPDADVRALCERVDKKLSSVGLDECLAVSLAASGAESNEGTAIAYRDYAPGVLEPVRVLLVGGIHGDEYSSVSVVFKWMSMLEEIARHDYHWRIVPVLNPDGLLRPEGMSQRMNANGVDLNRNFPTPDWVSEAPRYWQERTKRNPRRYPGPAPLSEPESAWLAEQIEHFRPDAVVSVHAPHGIVDFDGPNTPPQNLGPLELRLLGTYPGSMGRYIGIHKSIPLLTVELESAYRMPNEHELVAIWDDMVSWIERKLVPAEGAGRNARAAEEPARPGKPATGDTGAR